MISIMARCAPSGEAMDPQKDVLTTGQVARICQVAPRTVSKWFDSGELRGYRVPGSRERRIPKKELLRFMRAYGFPMERLETGMRRVLVVDPSGEVSKPLLRSLGAQKFCEIRAAESAFAAGVEAARFDPHAMIVHPVTPDLQSDSFAESIKARTGGPTVLIGVAEDQREADALAKCGYDVCMIKPLELSRVVGAIEEVRPF